MSDPRDGFQTRGRSKSSFSFRSASDVSETNKDKVDVSHLKESEKEKRKSKWLSKGTKDPNTAISDAQPMTRAMNENVTLTPLSSMQHKDWKGDIISDPDRSNPGRARMERPLDTIRSFEAAVDSNHKRKVMARSESVDLNTMSSRRESYIGGGNETPFNRYSTAQVPSNGSRSHYPRNGDYHQPRSNPYRNPSAPTGPPPVSEYDEYPPQPYRELHDTSYTRESNGYSSSEPWGNSTDPSSENSSVDRIHAPMKPEHGDAYGYAQNAPERVSPRHDAIQEEYGHDGNGYTQGHYDPAYTQQHVPASYGANGQPARPAQNGQTMPPSAAPGRQHQPQRNIIPLGGADRPPAPPPKHNKLQAQNPLQRQMSAEGKRKSWLSRKFSKRDGQR